jgi:hypothetical protein
VCVKVKKKKTESCTVVECHVSWWKLELVFLLDLRSWLIISGGFLLRKMANVSIHLIIISCLVLLYLMTPKSLIFFLVNYLQFCTLYPFFNKGKFEEDLNYA